MDVCIKIDSDNYLVENVFTIFDIKKYFLLNFNKVISQVSYTKESKEIILGNFAQVAKFRKKQLNCFIDTNFIYEDDEERYRCSCCHNYLKIATFTCCHLPKCRRSSLKIKKSFKASIKEKEDENYISDPETNTFGGNFNSEENPAFKENEKQEKEYGLTEFSEDSSQNLNDCNLIQEETTNISNENEFSYPKHKIMSIADNFAKVFNLTRTDNLNSNLNLNLSQKENKTNNSSENYSCVVLPREKIQEIVEFYANYFSGITKKTMFSWVKKSINMGCFLNDLLVGLVTFLLNSEIGIKFAYVKLLAVDEGHRYKKIASKLINIVYTDYSNKIVVWADNNSVGFYEKNKFIFIENLENLLSPITHGCNGAKLMSRGLSEDLEIIEDWRFENKPKKKKKRRKRPRSTKRNNTRMLKRKLCK